MTNKFFSSRWQSFGRRSLYLCLLFCLGAAPGVYASGDAPQSNATQGTHKIQGVVVDAQNEPLIGVTIMVVGTSTGTVTDADGAFTLNAKKGQTIRLSYTGYKTKTITVTEQRVYDVTLEEEVTSLDEAVVTSFMTQKKVSVIGSVQTVKPGSLKSSSTQLSSSFAGRLPGVIAVQRTGQPGADGSSFWIRGISTFGGRQEPLIIVDGIQVSSGDLNNIDPETIESFSILKDATATALYGTLGANGVMIVTTKSGKDMEKPRINVRLETIVSTPFRKPKLVDGVAYMQMYNEAQKNPSSTNFVPYAQSKIDGTIAGKDPIMYPNVNWYDELFKNYQVAEKALINITGGTKRVDYFSSLSVSHESGMLKSRSKDFFTYNNNIELWKYNFQNNLNLYLHPNTKLSARLNVQLRDYNGPIGGGGSAFSRVMGTNPADFPVLYPYSDERNQSRTADYLMWGGKTSSTATIANPVAEVVRGYTSNFQSTVIAQVDLDQKLDFITKGLNFKGFIAFKNWSNTEQVRRSGYNQFYVNQSNTDADGAITGYTLQNVAGSVQNTTLDIVGADSYGSGDRKMNIQGILGYNRTFNQTHDLGAMIVYNQEEFSINRPGSLKESLPYRKLGIAGRLTYGYQRKYMFEANFGYNGSENFAKGHRFGFFPSLALGYNISEEKFFEPLKNTITMLKLRGSWGLVGNDNSSEGRFLYAADLNLQGTGYTTGVEMNTSYNGPVYTRYENKDLTWEVGEKINLGLDLELFNELSLVFEWYKENRRDIFMERRTIPSFFGTGSTRIYGNLGKVENTGFEVSANYNKQFTKDFNMSFQGSFTLAKNKITEYDEPDFLRYPGKSRVGHSINQQLLYQADRLFIDQAEVANSPTQKLSGFVNPGDIKYHDIADVNGVADGQIDADDRVYSGHPTVPEIIYGFGPSFKYKKWDLSMYFQGAARTSLVMSGFHPFGTNYQNNVLQFIADDYWSESNQNIYAAYPRLSIADNANNTSASTYWQRDASFLKLKSFEVGYTHKAMRFYLTGSNLLTFSKFKLWDPEMGGGSGLAYPTMRTFSAGIQLYL